MGLFNRRKRGATDDPSMPSAPGADLSDPAPDGEDHVRRLDAFADLVEREWERLARPGTWWTGGERVAIAHDARLAAQGRAPSGILPAPVEEATRRLAVEPATIRGTDVARWDHDGLDPFAYIELTGIVSRLMGLDVAAFGLGLDRRDLPEPESGEPSRTKPEGAAITTAWAPTVGPASAASSLTAVPAEAEAMFDVHGVLYATMEQMFEMQLERDGLTRPQIELAAARTSSLNDCFY